MWEEGETPDLTPYGTSLYIADYPKHCLPNKLNKPKGKAKDLIYESIKDNYEPEANNVAFRVTCERLPVWIKSLYILYYEIYGKDENYTINWYDDPTDWSRNGDNKGKRSIIIDVGSKEITLLFKITLHISTGVLQVQGAHKNNFIKTDLPKLKQVASLIAKEHDINDSPTKTTEEDVSDTEEHFQLENKESDVSLHDTHPKLLLQNTYNQIETGLDDNNNSNKSKPQNKVENVDVVPYNSKNETQAFQCMLKRMEDSFSSALEKITTQQAALFETKLNAMEKIHSESLKSHNDKFSMLLNKFEDLSTKNNAATKEAEQFKTELKNSKHINTLEQETIKNKYETQINMLKMQNEKKSESFQKLNLDATKMSEKITRYEDKIMSLEVSQADLNKQLLEKDKEILSLKIHNGSEESNDDPFKIVTRRREKQEDKRTPSNPVVTIVGTSNIANIDPQRMSTHYSVNKIPAYTLDQTEAEVKNLPITPKVLVLHSLTNDLKTQEPEACASKMDQIVDICADLYKDTHIIISLPTPRADNSTYHNRGILISALLKEKYKDNNLITICDNSNLSYKNEPLMKFLNQEDGVHLNENGVKVLASNFRDSIDRILGMPKRQTNPQYYRRQSEPFRGFRGRGRGQRRGGRGGRGRYY